MGEIVEGLDAAARERIAALRRAGEFFWADVMLGSTSRDELAATFDIPAPILAPLLDFSEASRQSQKFRADGEHVVFAFSCFPQSQFIEAHVLVTGDYVLTLHREPLPLPQVLDVDPPGHGSEQHLVYAILDAMVDTAFDVLIDAELRLESLQLVPTTNMRAVRPMGTLRQLTSRLGDLRRRVAPQRGLCERISEEIGRLEELGGDSAELFERICGQLNRLVEGIDAAGDAISKLIDLRLNETIYWLTVLSTIILPLTFITGFFGMNFPWMIARIHGPTAFVLLGIGLPIAAVAVTVWAVRRRGAPVEPDQPARAPR